MSRWMEKLIEKHTKDKVHDKCGTPDCCGECATAEKYIHESDNSLNSKEKKVPQLNQQVIEI